MENQLSDLQKVFIGKLVGVKVTDYMRDEMGMVLIGDTYDNFIFELTGAIACELHSFDLVKRNI